jgi:hypothetical protein
MTKFITRAYNNIRLNTERFSITKESRESRLADEINYFLEIPSSIQHLFPRLISYNKENCQYFMELEYYPFENLGKLPLDADWKVIAKSLKNSLELFQEVSYAAVSSLDTWQHRHYMFIDKTENEYNSLKRNFIFFTSFCKQKFVKINDIEYLNFESLWKILKPYIMKEYCTNQKFSFIHGDMCFSNILCGFDKEGYAVLKFIDPRGSFGIKGIYGDSYYDLAKLMHSTHGRYEDIIYDKFIIKRDNKDKFINYQFTNKENNSEIFSEIIFNSFDRLKIQILQGLIFIGMCARHYDSESRQKIMYATGIKILNECLQEIR